MVVVMLPGVRHDERNLVGVKRIMVAVALRLPVEVELGSVLVVALADKFAESRGGPDAVHLERLLIESADHIDIDHKPDLLERNRRMFHPMFRAEQPALFGIPECEKNRA